MTARGIVALGDSITRGKGGAPALGVHPQSWVAWLAEALDLPLHNLATDGAVAADLVRDQLPRVAAPPADRAPDQATGAASADREPDRAAGAASADREPDRAAGAASADREPAAAAGDLAGGGGRPYALATLYVGVNDARGTDFDAAGFEADVETLVAGLSAAADRVLVLTVPLDLGRPRAGHDVVAADAALRRRAETHGAIVCGLERFGGPRVLLPDAVHPTSPGMVAIAGAAADALAAAGVPVPVRPAALADERTDPRARARYAAWWARQLARDRLRQARERRR